MGLSQERLPVVQRDCFSSRDMAQERIGWCRHIELIQNLGHMQNHQTAYLTDPMRRCICDKHGYQSLIEDSDWTALVQAFKKTYCDGCPDRKPLKNALEPEMPGTGTKN